MKEPRTTTPGSKDRWEMRIRITRRKMRAREDVAISNGKSLFFFSLSLSFFSKIYIYFYLKCKMGDRRQKDNNRGKKRKGEGGKLTRESRLGGCFGCL